MILLVTNSDKNLIPATFFASFREVRQQSPNAKMFSLTPGAVGLSLGSTEEI
jgi:hypothetical protein